MARKFLIRTWLKRYLTIATKNQIEWNGDYFLAKMSRGYSFKFDEDDLSTVCSRTWYPSFQGHMIYACDARGNTLHSVLIPDLPRGYEIDHVNRDSLDNRRCNLRVCTHQQNQFNHDLQRNNTSGYAGVSYFPSRKKFRARIKYSNREIHLGYFLTIEEASQARSVAEHYLFGEYGVGSSIHEASHHVKLRVQDKLLAIINRPINTQRACYFRTSE